MPRLSEADIAEVTGRPAPKPETPGSRVEDAIQKLGELDGRMSSLVERHRQPGESHEQAHARILMENPSLYDEHKRAKAQIIKSKGLGDAATGGV
jgi:hypothetical protein